MTEAMTKPAPRTQHRKRSAVDIVQWVIVVIGAAGGVLLPLAGANSLAFMFGAGLMLAFTQGIRRYGTWRLVAFFLIAFVFSNFWEDLSIATGFPFGEYHYTGPFQLISVPIQIGIVYFGLGYISWMTTSVLLGGADRRLNLGMRTGRVNVVALPVMAGSVMTMFDVGVDSVSSTVQNNWIWERGGGFFGVPWTNYVGWWFVTWTFFQVFALMLARHQTRTVAPFTPSGGGPLAQPVLLYASLGVSSVTAYLGQNAAPTVTDQAGFPWTSAAIYESMMIVNVFGTIAVALFGIAQLARGPEDPEV